MQTPQVRAHPTGTQYPLRPDSVEARLERRGDEALARYLADDPREPRYTHENRFWLAAAVIAILVSCAMPFAFALLTLPLPVK